ncbi:MAG: DUF4294 domain-containing protein [Brumimicrobium sp.]|nr:DUF4294 domain-containing protein [Brumimicrobium sp.]
MKYLFFLFFILLHGVFFAQNEEDTTIRRIQVYDGFSISNRFHSEYRNLLPKVQKVYPLALEAAKIIDSLNQELGESKNKRQQKKIKTQTKKDLKENFKFLVKDLYVSEGQVLMKLIYRETGMSVNEIIRKYGSGAQAAFYSGMAYFFEQDLDAVYHPNDEDFVIECIVQDIKSGKVYCNKVIKTINKQEYKENMKEYRIQRKKTSKVVKDQKKKDKSSKKKK